MGITTKAYILSLESKDGKNVIDFDVMNFFQEIEKILNSNPQNVIRRINDKIMRVHAYEWPDLNKDFVVIPFGKLKEKNKPMANDPDTQKLVDFEQNMYDVNLLAYSKDYRVALITTNINGPRNTDIEDYLNTYLPNNCNFKITLTLLVRNIGIEKIKKAKLARNITIELDLGKSTNNFLQSQVNEEKTFLFNLNSLVQKSKDTLDSKTFKMVLGLGRKRNDSLNISAIVEILENLNLDSGCIKEITVNYKDGSDEPIDTAKLRESTEPLKIIFQSENANFNPHIIINTIEENLRNERSKYYDQVKSYFSKTKEIGDKYELIEKWPEKPRI